MKYDLKDLTERGKSGQQVWITDYRKRIDEKAIRHVKPTLVVLLSEDDFIKAGKKWKRVYYSRFAFVPLNAKGEPKYSSPISPYDTTGYRSNTGVGVNAFDNENECIRHYNEQVHSIIEDIDHECKNVIVRLQAEKTNLLGQLLEEK